jgi:WASH complex subunit strumpellin
MKLSSIMNTPMNRLIMLSMLPEDEKEARTSEEIRSVSMYYSAELMKFVRNVLQIIPRRVFSIANDLANVLTPKIKNMPGEIEQKELREYALFENRLMIAKCCKEIAVYTDGIMSMDKYIIGMIAVIPMKILEEGLRRELLVMLGDNLNKKLRFGNVKTYEEFESLLTNVGEELDSLKRGVEYIQDMLNIQGLKIWYDEYNKLVSVYVDAEWEFIREEVLPDEALKWASSENKTEG